MYDAKIKAWSGNCEICGKAKDEEFTFVGSLAVDSEIKGLCKNCEKKKQCDICQKWGNDYHYLTVSGGGCYQSFNFCGNECKNQARKQAKQIIADYKQRNNSSFSKENHEPK